MSITTYIIIRLTNGCGCSRICLWPPGALGERRLYKTTGHYAPEHERSVAWNDPVIGIGWSTDIEPALSTKDRAGVPLRKRGGVSMRQLNTSTFWRITAAVRAVRPLLGRLCYSRLGYPLVLAWHTLRTCSRVPLRDWRAERVIERSGLFDKDWYLKNNPDVVEWGVNPVRHYVVFGAKEGRDPSSFFRTRRYLSENRDVAGAGINPLAHFVLYGAAEGRASGADPPVRRQYPITTKPVNADERSGLLIALALIPEAVRSSAGAGP